ncbi:GNAT family N-acetyltransferase [Actinoplanes sp. NPDC026670]|uniref:GNAT family N-acetyltransferase n=1 Tax=Actinoplanes sp. NPDC026670 TaxID=3154700 RepID=UPI0033F493D6
MTASLLEPAAREWKETLQQVSHDMYHVPDYVVLDARLYGGVPAAFHFEQDGRRLLIPLILRDIPGTGLKDAISPYGYPGPVGTTDDPAFWDAACSAFIDVLSGSEVVSAFVRLHPLLPTPVLADHGKLVYHGETVSMDLTVSEDEMWKQTRADHRNHINRAKRAGTEIVFDDWDRLGEWVEVYHDNMRRVGATSYYFFTREHLSALHDAVGDKMHLVVALEDGEVVGGNTFFSYDGIATGYVSSTRRAPKRYADELLYDSVRRWCKSRGDKVFHLGGGKGGANDSLFSYKAGFSPSRNAFHTWRVITDPGAYQRLVHDRRPDADPADLTATFPAYR